MKNRTIWLIESISGHKSSPWTNQSPVTSLHSFHGITSPYKKIIRNGQAILEINFWKIERSDWLRAFRRMSLGKQDFSRKIVFRRMIEDHEFFHFRQKKVHINGLDFCQNSNNLIFRPFWALFAQIWANRIFPEKLGSVTFDPLWIPIFIPKIRKNLWPNSEKS